MTNVSVSPHTAHGRSVERRHDERVALLPVSTTNNSIIILKRYRFSALAILP
jgi:hypothetical protein